MSATVWTVLSFLVCLLGFTLVGVWASRVKQDNTEDYLLAGRSVSPGLTALSAVATNNSGYMFIGLIGYAYTSGLAAVWLQVAWILGDWFAWRYVQRGVRTSSGQVGALSVSDWLGRTSRAGTTTEKTTSSEQRGTIAVSALLTFLFLGGYAAAQLKAGSTSLQVLFGWPLHWGALIGTVIIVVYCFSGGMRASIWTDAAQSLVMIVSMTLLAVVGLIEAGGPTGLIQSLRAISADLLLPLPGGTWGSAALFFAGFVFGGLGGLGQPHILSRVMALRDPREIDKTRGYYFGWFIPFSILTLMVGLEARVLLPELSNPAGGIALGPEHALPLLSLHLLPSVLVGLMLAGIFAATMSTADSQVLACTAAITQDLFPRLRGNYRAAKWSTLVTALLALGIALFAQEGVFAMVLMAWSILGAGLGPLVVVRAWNRMPSQPVALAMMFTGISVVLLFHFSGWGSIIYEILPGMVASFLVYLLFGRGTQAQLDEVSELPSEVH